MEANNKHRKQKNFWKANLRKDGDFLLALGFVDTINSSLLRELA